MATSTRDTLGEFEQLLLLAIVHLGDDAYGVTIRQEIEARTGRDVAIGALYTSLDRLERKGFVRSTMSEPTPERGGRSKRCFQHPSRLAPRPSAQSRERLARMWDGLTPDLRKAAAVTPRPPSARRVADAARRSDRADRHAVLGDLHEEFRVRARETARARRGAGAGGRSVGRSCRIFAAGSTQSRDARAASESPAPSDDDSRLKGSAQDLRHAVRSLRATPTFTIVALVVLTLGIGATTAIFSVVDGVALRGVPFPRGNRLDRRDRAAAERQGRDERRAAGLRGVALAEQTTFEGPRGLAGQPRLRRGAITARARRFAPRSSRRACFACCARRRRSAASSRPEDEVPGNERVVDPERRVLAASIRRRSAGHRPDHDVRDRRLDDRRRDARVVHVPSRARRGRWTCGRRGRPAPGICSAESAAVQPHGRRTAEGRRVDRAGAGRPRPDHGAR